MTVHIGKDFYLNSDKIVAVLPYNTSRLKDEVKLKKEMPIEMRDGTFVDATRGGKISSVILCQGGVYILSCMSPETIAKRFDKAVFAE